nr:hypothetical protein [Tanacetum cinerariifolium]
MSTRHYLEIKDEAFGKLKFYGEWSENEIIEAEGLCEYALVLPHTDKKETVLLEEAKAQKAPQNVKPKSTAMNTKEAAKKPKPAENVKEFQPKEPAEKAQKAPQNVKPKPAAMKTNEVAEKPKPAENTKKAAEKPMPVENVKELAEKPKEPAGDDYQVVRTATIMKDEDREEFEDELHAWPWVVEPVNMVQPSTPKRVFFSPSKEYVKLVKPVNSPYMCRRIDVTARCKRIEFVLGNSLFAMEGDKYETVFQSLGGYRELSSVHVNMETLAPTLWIDANVIDCIIKGTLTEEEQWKSFYDEIKVFFPIYASDHFYFMVFNIKKPKIMIILDNSDSGYTYASKYKEACDPLKKLFSRYLKEQNYSSHEAVAKMRPFIPKLKWRTSNNHVDCRVFAMIHMENYVGDTAKNYEFGLCEESDEQLSMLQRLRYKIATKIMLHQFNAVSNKMFDFAFTFETKNTEQARVSMIVDAIKNMNNRDPSKQVKETGAANVV